MATVQADASQPDTSEAAPSVVNLQIVSPNVGVGPLVFTAITLDTTVAQLKQKIRESLATHPTDEHQRLIHRGRLLARDSDTLKDIFPEEVLRSGDKQTLHLVLRDITDRQPPAPAPAQSTPTRGQSPAPGNIPPQPGVNIARLNFHLNQRPHGVHNAAPIPPNPGAVAGFAPPGSHPSMMQQQQQHHLSQWMNQLHRQHMMHQQQQRAQAGSQGPQDNTHQWHGLPADHAGGRNSPAASMPTNTVVREGYGPNGYWRVTVNETVSTSTSHTPHTGTMATASSSNRGPLSPADLANIMRGADATQATQAMTNAMHRSTSGASLASMANRANFNGPVQPIQPGVTNPVFPGISTHGSRTATPDPWSRTQSQPQPQASASAGQPEVYILSSPTGPRGILINGSLEMYVTPAPARPLGAFPFIPSPYAPRLGTPPVPQSWSVHGQVNQPQGQFRTPQPQPQPQAQHHAQPQHQAQAQVQPRLQPLPGRRILQDVPVRPFHAHPNNPGAGALIAAAWPHIWLIVRLVLFVWWFTSNDPSWSRWLTMVAIAVAVFLFNTGILNGIANQAWNPLRQHLEGLLPLAPPDPQVAARPAPEPRQAAGNGVGGNAGPAGNTTNPDPAQTAARLFAERRNANAHWLLGYVRRFERAGLLFLASIAPGVAERHIAHLEAQERAERQRREAEEATAAAAAAAADAATDGQAVDAGQGAGGNPDGAAEERQEVVPEQPPLIQV